MNGQGRIGYGDIGGGLGNGCGPTLMAYVLVGVLLVMFCGCKHIEYVPVVEHHTEYVAKTDTFLQKDSVVLHDSVYIHQKGDTVWYEKWHTRYKDRIREVIRTDTFVKVDSIRVPYPVEKKLTRWQQLKVDFGGEAMVTVAILIFIIVWLVYSKLRR